MKLDYIPRSKKLAASSWHFRFRMGDRRNMTMSGA